MTAFSLLLLFIMGVAMLVLALAIAWPLNPAADDVMQQIHGDQPRPICPAARTTLSKENSAGLALRSDADGGWSLLRSRFASISEFFKRGRHA